MSESVLTVCLQIVKSVVVSLIFLFLGVSALAFIVNTANLSVSVLHPAVQVIKPLSILTGVLCGVRGGKGALKGLLSGALAFFLTWLLLTAMAKGGYAFSSTMIDFLAFLSFGCCSGMVAVTLKNK